MAQLLDDAEPFRVQRLPAHGLACPVVPIRIRAPASKRPTTILRGQASVWLAARSSVSEWRNSSKVMWGALLTDAFLEQHRPCWKYGSKTADVNRLHTEMSKMLLPDCNVVHSRLILRV
jgi:hypothetical protein